jgi:hypothetical protein
MLYQGQGELQNKGKLSILGSQNITFLANNALFRNYYVKYDLINVSSIFPH